MSFLSRSAIIGSRRFQFHQSYYLRNTLNSIRLFDRKININYNPNRYLSSKKTEKDEPSSILSDDILAKAGFEVDEIEKHHKESERQKQIEEAERQEKENEKENENDSDNDKRERRKRVSSLDRKRDRWGNLSFFSFVGATILGTAYLARNWDEGEEEKITLPGESYVDNGYTPGLMYERFKKRFQSIFSYFSEPAFEELLPPSPPEPYKRPLTLVIGLENLLVHSEWTKDGGWRTAKRPGLDYFLSYLSLYYEIVIFSSNSFMYNERTIERLDPNKLHISYALHREAARYVDGKIIKDLSLMNRDLGKIIIVDTDPNCFELQPDNAIGMKPWDGKPDDKLIRLIPILEYIAAQPNIKDIRPIIRTFEDKFKIPEEFHQREMKLREEFKKEYELKKKNHKGNWAFKLLGLQPLGSTANVSSNGIKQDDEPKMYIDLIREEGQRQYKSYLKFLEEKGQEMLEKQKQMEKQMLSDQKFSINKLLTEGMPNQEDIAKAQIEKMQKVQQAQPVQ
ncbi:protein translocase subunit TIM50 [Ascoidea rubescens DSM 1968]|uniref:Mitochondrial import inner membrane translocase subunit TIM50 n=1 Tax=Ascoidea rubescens DSM 1968 TaxID=1344418 RepID=A0A1D2VRL1_9ASCO|nr:HAD-like protein [Ascoidea rubescens DSM 1968]ODV64229.1 HAD-like protein [Ascoidea rubescens DSM 1968]